MLYVISKQGNRRLVMQATDLEWFKDYADAHQAANANAKSYNLPWFVHQVDIKCLESHRPTVEVKVTPVS